MPLEIDYVAEGFPSSCPVSNGPGVLATSWDELLGAAVTVGRPNWHYVFRHGQASRYEALFRWSLVRMSLEQSGPLAWRFRRTTAARTLDPSEKGAVSYFLGLTVSKLFAERLLGTPWLLHLDVFRPMVNPVLIGRSRPDLVGEMTGGGWLALESKGRVSPPDATARTRAKQQAQRLLSVNGVIPSYHIGAITFFRNETLRFYWNDPQPSVRVRNPIRVEVTPDMWRAYYAPVFDLIRSHPEQLARMREAPALMYIAGANLEVGIRPDVLRTLEEGRWEDARHRVEAPPSENDVAHYRKDGIVVKAGKSWFRPYEEAEGSRRRL